jgi:hypothetical protein
VNTNQVDQYGGRKCKTSLPLTQMLQLIVNVKIHAAPMICHHT